MSAGHGGASGRYKRFKDIAKDFAFLIGINETIVAQ
jgi:protease II